MTTLLEIARDPDAALANLEKKFGVAPGTLLAEMAALSASAGEDWTKHLPYDIARAYYADKKARAPFEEHVSGCDYCKRLLETLHPMPAEVSQFAAKAAWHSGGKHSLVARLTRPVLITAVILLVVVGWFFFSRNSAEPVASATDCVANGGTGSACSTAAAAKAFIEPVRETVAAPSPTAAAGGDAHSARAWVGDTRIGSAHDEKRDLPAASTEPVFVAGEPVRLVTQVEGAPSNTPVTVVWYGPKEQPVREETNWTRGNEKALSFTAPDTSDWTSGDYRAELWIANSKVKQEPFEIRTPSRTD